MAGTWTWSDSQSFSFSVPDDGNLHSVDLLTIPAGMAPSTGGTLFVALAAADLAGSPNAQSGSQAVTVVDPLGLPRGLLSTGVSAFPTDALGGTLAGAIEAESRSNGAFFPLNDGGHIRLTLAHHNSPAADVTVTGVVAAAIFDVAGTMDTALTVLKTVSGADSGTIATDPPLAGETYFAFVALGADVVQFPPTSSPAALLPDFSGGGTTDWVNIVRITNGILWAGIGHLAVVAPGPTNPYVFTNVSARKFGGNVIGALQGVAAQSRARAWVQVIG